MMIVVLMDMLMTTIVMMTILIATLMVTFTGFSSGGCISWRTGTSGGLHFYKMRIVRSCFECQHSIFTCK